MGASAWGRVGVGAWARAGGEMEEEEANVKLPVEPALLDAHNRERSRHRALGAAEGETRAEDGDLHRLDDGEDLEEHAQQRAHHAQRAHLRVDIHGLKVVPRRLDDAGEGEAGEQRSLRADGE